MAVQLERAGAELGVVALFDTATSHALPFGARLVVPLQRASYHAHKLVTLRSAYVRKTLYNFARGLRERVTRRQLPSTPDLFARVLARYLAAIANYAAQPLPRYGGTVDVILAQATSHAAVSERFDARLGWRHAVAHVVVHRVPGNHLSMLEPPDVDTLAGTLRQMLGASKES